MKMHSLKTFMLCCTMVMMASSIDVAARERSNELHCFSKHRVDRLRDRVDTAFHIIFSDLDNIFAYQGASADPNPETNAAVQGNIIANRADSLAASAELIDALRQLGVHQPALNTISDQIEAMIDAAILYAIDVNLANTGQPSGDQVAAAEVLIASAQALGTTFFALTGDPRFPGILTENASLLTQLAQAYRLVLDDSNAFDADPSDPATETAAAVRISAAIHRNSSILSNLLVKDLADKECSSR